MENIRELVREKFNDLFENSLNYIIVCDLNGMVLDANDVTLKTFGYNRDEIVNKPISEFIYLEDLRQLAKAIKELRKIGKTSRTNTYRIRIKQGGFRYAEINGTPIRKDNKIVAILGIGHDVTEKREAHLKLKESEENYRAAYERENFYKDLFTHDASNILQSMLMSLEMCELKINKLNISDDIKNSINLFKDQIKRGSDLVNNVKKFSDLYESDRILKKLRVKAVLEDAEKIVRNFSNHKKIDIKYDNLKEDYLIQADDFLINVFENILINAVKHNDNQFTETIVKFSEIQENGKKLLKMEFLDNGRGIPDFDKNRIFNREDIKDRSVRGLGLGLSLVKTIIDKSNTKIWVEDKVKGDYTQGSNFVIIFPLVN